LNSRFHCFFQRFGEIGIIAPTLITDADDEPSGGCDAHDSLSLNWWVEIRTRLFIDASVSACRDVSELNLSPKSAAAEVDAGDERLSLFIAPFSDITRELWTIRQHFE
jgi:hypothetical protein